MRNNGRQSFIEQTGSRYAQHKFAAAPAIWKLLFFNLRLGPFELGKRRILLRRFCTPIVYISVRRKVVDELGNRVADAAHLIFVDRWLSEQTFVDLVALCQFAGPASSQTGIAIGLIRGTCRGAALGRPPRQWAILLVPFRLRRGQRSFSPEVLEP